MSCNTGKSVARYSMTTSQKVTKQQIKIDEKLTKIMRKCNKWKGKVDLIYPTVGAKNICLKFDHTSMSHCIQDCSRMRS